MLVAQQLKHLHGLEFAFLLALGLRLLVKFWGCKGRLLLQGADGCTRMHTHTRDNKGKGESHESKPSTLCTLLPVITGVRSTTVAQTLNNPTGKAPESTQNRFKLSFCTQFHEWLMLSLTGVSSENTTPKISPTVSYLSF